MDQGNDKFKPIQFIRDLCKDKPEMEIRDAEENFREYLLVIKEICDRKDAAEDSLSFDDQKILK